MLKLSIIIPVYNIEEHLPKCLDSLLDQDLDASTYEIIIVDDGSMDNSLQIAASYSIKFDNIHSISKENGGVSTARNKGLELATGKYIYFIDPDDYLAPNVLGVITGFCESNDLDVLTFNSETLTETKLYESKSNKNSLSISKICTGTDYIGRFGYDSEVWYYIIKRELIDRLGISFIEGKWMEDAIFTTQLFLGAEKMAHLPIDAHRHIKFPTSAMRSKEPSHYLKVIRDYKDAAILFKSIIDDTKNRVSNNQCLMELKTRQESFVFFMMYRMLGSTIKLKEIRMIFKQMHNVGAYPLTNFLGKDYNGAAYFLAVKLFNTKPLFYLAFIIFNPAVRLIYHLRHLNNN